MFDVDKLLISRFGRTTYEKGLNYLGDVYLNDSTTNGNLRYYKFSVESERFFNHYYSVVVIIHNNDIFRYGCNCPEFVKNHKCKHILASIINYKSQMFNRSQEDINIESTREILEFFKNNSITNNIKEKLNLDLELDFSYNRKTVYLAVGLNKTYVIKTERKLEDFMDAYYKKYPYKFGIKFTYDSNKHFFSDEDKKN